MKKVIVGALAGFLFIAAASQVSFAQSCGCGGPMGMGGGMGMHGGPGMMHNGMGPEAGFLWQKLMGLGLTDKQVEAVKAIREKVTKDTIKKRADLQLAHVELKELLDKDTVDMSAVTAQMKKTESMKTDLHLSHIKAMEEMKAVLTPEQRKKFKEETKGGYPMREGMRRGGMGSMPCPMHDDQGEQ